MKRLSIIVLLLTACGAERSAPTERRETPATQQASLGCRAFRDYQTCNAQPTCMWAGGNLGCIKRVE